MGSRIIIREMEIHDLNPVFVLGKTIFINSGNPLLTWDEDNITGIICGGMDFSFVAARKKEITGFLIAAGIIDDKSPLKIYWMGVKESLKNKGIEEMLLSALINKFKSFNIERIEIDLPKDNAGMIEFFKKSGFTGKREFITLQFT